MSLIKDDNVLEIENIKSEEHSNSHWVAVKTEFLLQKKEKSGPSQSEDPRSASSGSTSKKRPRDSKPEAKDRLCSSIKNGTPCDFGAACKYEHDPTEFLSKKPADIGPICFSFETYGYCPSGLMCRFGDSHIDRVTGTNLTRTSLQGGTVHRADEINVLSKELQRMLRKKQYQPPKAREITSLSSTVEAVEDDAKDVTALNKTVADFPISADSSKSLTIGKNFDHSYNLEAYDSFVKLVDFSDKVYVAPLTTIGNMPFRRIMKELGADITCGEMAMISNLEQGQASEWALLRRHHSEDTFGVQLAGSYADQMAKVARMLSHETVTDFVDLNCGCPIDVVCSKGSGSALMTKPKRLCDMVAAMTKNLNRPVTVKVRTGWTEKEPTAHQLIPMLQKIAKGKIAAVMIHGRSRQQRYSKAANWDYIYHAAKSQDPSLPPLPIIGNGDIFSYEDWREHSSMLRARADGSLDDMGICSCAMIGRGALIKPWLPQEIKESRHIDISATERLDILKKFCNYGLDHWGSDQQGVNTTRRFMLEWQSFLHRYVPTGILEHRQKMQQRPPSYIGRCDLETLLSSPNAKDWIKVSEMFLGPVADDFQFEPKHKSNSYADAESNG